MTCKKNLAALALAVSVSSIATVTAQAQNPGYANGDLVLFFQSTAASPNPGFQQTLFVTLGNTALDFRGGAAGVADGVTEQNIINIGSALSTAFGASWATETTLYAGLAGVWGTAGDSPFPNNTLQNGDPNRTIYASNARTGLGAVATAGSAAWTVSTDGGMSSASSSIQGAFGGFETIGTSGVTQLNFGQTTLETAAIAGGTSFGAFTTPGVQQVGTAGTLGSFAGVDNVEFALDLYRILAKTTAPGQIGGPAGRLGSYEGTVVLDSLGNVSFIGATPVPEPSSALLFGGVIGAAGFIRRRNRA